MEKLGTVLVVDGDPVARDTFTNLLASRGFLVETFGDGNDVLDRLEGENNGASVGVAVIALSLGDMSGQVLSQRIHKRFKHIIAVFITNTVPIPIIAGYRVFPKPLQDTEDFCNFVWQLMKTTAWSSKFSELKKSIDAQILTSADCRASFSKRIGEMGLLTVVKNEWSSSSALAKWLIGALGSIITVLFATASYLGLLVIDDTRAKVQAIIPLRELVIYRLEPTIKGIQAQQVVLEQGQQQIQKGMLEILKRLPSSPTSSVATASTAYVRPHP